VFRISVAKVDRDVAHIAMAMHQCFKCMFQMFDLYHTYVASVFIWMLHIHACYKQWQSYRVCRQFWRVSMYIENNAYLFLATKKQCLP
jgi:uncharacterized membrane protein